jgi:MFS family permease
MSPGGLPVLRRRDFRLLFGAQAVSVLGDRMAPIALAFAVLEQDGSPSEVGLVLASRVLALVASLLIGGVVADRTSRRAVMVAADVVRLASQGALAALLIAGAPSIAVIVLLTAVSGAATGFFNPAATGLLPAVVEPAQLQQANGLRATAAAAGEIAGPLLAGVLVASVSPGWALAVDAATFGVSAALLVRLRPPARARRATVSFAADLRSGWDVFRARTWAWTFVAAVAFTNLLWGAWSVLGPVVADDELGGAAAWGAVLATLGAGALAGGLLGIRAEPRRPLVLAALMGLTLAVPLALLAAAVPVALLAAGAFVMGVGMMLSNSVWESTLQRRMPPESLSRVSSYDWFGSLAIQPIGLAIWGPVASLVGVAEALWLAAALVVATTLALVAVPDIRRVSGACR